MTLSVTRLKLKAVNTLLMSLFKRVTPADSIATSVPVPIAIPTSEAARAGASLIPSPTKATLSNSFTLSAF